MKLELHRAGGRRGLRRLAAFTMIEIALALAVIGFAAVAIIGVLPAGMSVQKDNRESTLINFDANFLLDAITSGSTGLDDLTNHIIAITNYYVFFNVTTAGAITPATANPLVIGYTTNGTYGKVTVGAPVLTNGANIVALLTTPKYIPSTGGFYSNYITADFRGITGSLADQGMSQNARDFAFSYRVFPEIIPYFSADNVGITNNPDPNMLVAHNFQGNYTQVRLRFRWPLLPKGQVGNSRLTFRTSASGVMVSSPSLVGGAIPMYAIRPGTYVGF